MPVFLQQFPIFTPLLALLSLALVFGALLGFARTRFRLETDPVIEQINALLPQTQCAQCGYPGCRPYAEAIAAGDAINKCPPGGEETIIALADLLNLEPQSLDPAYGREESPKVAYIREAECIGCTLCIPACPVDAILGSAQQMHTIISSECTGCELCLEPCPVDCIDILPLEDKLLSGTAEYPDDETGIQACIRCGFCEQACPVDLQPQQIYWHARAREHDKAKEYELMDCIECARCDLVCPSKIPLVQYFRASKFELRKQAGKQTLAQNAQERYDYHQQRLARDAELSERRRQERAALAQAAREKTTDPIQAALARIKAKKASQQIAVPEKK